MTSTDSAARIRAHAVTPAPLKLHLSPLTAAALVARAESLTAWPDAVRWDVLDGTPDDQDTQAALIPPTALHTRCLADAVVLAAWRRSVGQAVLIARDHVQTGHAWAVIVPA